MSELLETRRRVVSYLEEHNPELAEEYRVELGSKVTKRGEVIAYLKSLLIYALLIGPTLVGFGGAISAVLQSRWLEAMVIFFLMLVILAAVWFLDIIMDSFRAWLAGELS